MMKPMNVLVDIDGTVSDDIPNEESHKFGDAKVIEGSVESVNRLHDDGHIITFFTSRTEIHREATETWLIRNGFKYNSLLMGKPRGGNYVWVDNLLKGGVSFDGSWINAMSEIYHMN